MCKIFHTKNLKEIWTSKNFPFWLLCKAPAHNRALLRRVQWFLVGSIVTGLLLGGLPQYSCHAAAPCWPLPCCVPEVKCSTRSEGPGCELSPLKIFRERSVSWFQMMLKSKCPFFSKNFNACFYQSTKAPLKWHVGRYKRHETLPLRFIVYEWGFINFLLEMMPSFSFSSLWCLQFSSCRHVLGYISEIPFCFYAISGVMGVMLVKYL